LKDYTQNAIFSLTSDIDWASEYCIEDFVELVSKYGVKPTLFVTHPSKSVEKYNKDGKIAVGLHPNFFEKSSHGNDYNSVIDYVFKLYPDAKVFRSHSFFDNSSITSKMHEMGIQYDSNLCLYLQNGIMPLRHSSNIIRLPVFWEDDVHWNWDKEWIFSKYVKKFLSSGLKILNFHPFLVTINAPDINFYNQAKKYTKTLSKNDVNDIQYKGKGIRTFLIEILEYLSSNNHQFYTLENIFKKYKEIL